MNNKNIVYVAQRHVQCEGQGNDLGHPLIYLEIKDKEVMCPYCSTKLHLKDKK